MAVRYDKKFNKEISNVVAAYNRKITRLSKGGYDYPLPKRVTKANIRDIKSSAVSRVDVRRRLQELKTFTNKGAENYVIVEGVNMPKYQYENIKRYRRLLKVQTNRKLKEYETRNPILNGKEQPLTFSQYGTAEYLTFKAKRELLLEKDLKEMNFKERQEYIDTLRANTKTVDLGLWQKNFLTIFEDTALSYGYDTKKLDIVMALLKKLTPEEIDDLTFINSNIKDVIYGYKRLENIKSAKTMEATSKDVRSNLDNILSNITENLKDYLSAEDFNDALKDFNTEEYRNIIDYYLTDEDYD